ncbi:hypothetical protein L1987_14857 [Smallanthus sonchifolius]|uniref:Uncharacterized protein n=1 Tax=Smallanthus sonchifolius TaxID=185202 RepID=A0ACB9J4D0_9ASTR|nr:hypothetical protein L1987_14857 [Smallanthus sonchifolius]
MDNLRADTRRRANANPDWNTKATFALNLPSGGGSGWGKTFKDALTNQGAHGGNSEMESHEEDSNSIFIPEEAAVGNECYNRSLVGRSNDLKTLNDLNLGKVYDEPRPKKRIRASMEDDPFNLNALLGLIDARPKSVDGSESNRDVPSFEEFLGFDFDLNTRASDNSCSAESGEHGLADTTSEGNGSTDIGSPTEAPASLVEEKEIKDTIEIGCLTGVNLLQLVNLVKEVIQEEGNNVVTV